MLQWKNKSGRVSGWRTGRGEMTAVQRNQIKTDNKWSAEEACGHRAEVRELLTTTITHSVSVFFICSICRFPILVCITLSHFFWFSFIISDTSPAPICSIWVFSLLSFISFTQLCLNFLTFLCLLDCPHPYFSGSSLFSCLNLYLGLYSVTFLLRNNTTFWEIDFFSFLPKTYIKRLIPLTHLYTEYEAMARLTLS